MKNKKTKLIVNIATWVLLGVILAFAVFNVVMKSTNQVVFIFGRANLFVLTNSMEPTIPEKTYISIEKVSPENIKEDDIITFYSDDPSIAGSLNTHRVKEIIVGEDGKLYFRTKGDHNSIADNYLVSSDKIVGRYVSNLVITTFLGRFFMSTGGLIVILLLIMLMAASLIAPMFKKKQPENNEQPSEEEKQKLIDEMVKAEVERMKKEEEEKKNRE